MSVVFLSCLDVHKGWSLWFGECFLLLPVRKAVRAVPIPLEHVQHVHGSVWLRVWVLLIPKGRLNILLWHFFFPCVAITNQILLKKITLS